MYEKTLKSKKIYEGKILDLIVSDVELDNGMVAKREIVKHNGAVAIVAITDDKKILMVRQYRVAVEKDVLEIPAGLIEENEQPEKTALRELKEETGYTAKSIIKIHDYYTSPGFTNEKVYIYLATDLTKGEQDLDDEESLEVEKFHISDLENLLKESEDSKTIIGLLYLSRYLNK